MKKNELLSFKYIGIYLIYLVVVALFWYFCLPVINFRSESFYIFLTIILSIPFAVIFTIIYHINIL